MPAKHMIFFIKASRLNSSFYGNPNWEVEYVGQDGENHSARTSVDAACGYEVGNFREGDCLIATFTRAGRIATLNRQK